MSVFDDWNGLSTDEAEVIVLVCCGSRRWAIDMVSRRPFDSEQQLFETAHGIWWSLDREDWLEAFSSHPRIGERPENHASEQAKAWSSQEQAAAFAGDCDIKIALAIGNRRYEEQFGYRYLVCATGKSSEELLAILLARLDNQPGAELLEAASEQEKIMEIRLRKWLDA